MNKQALGWNFITYTVLDSLDCGLERYAFRVQHLKQGAVYVPVGLHKHHRNLQSLYKLPQSVTSSYIVLVHCQEGVTIVGRYQQPYYIGNMPLRSVAGMATFRVIKGRARVVELSGSLGSGTRSQTQIVAMCTCSTRHSPNVERSICRQTDTFGSLCK